MKKQTKKQTKKQQSGRSMIEMVGVLAVMGLITAAAFVLINSAMSSQRLSRIDDDVSGIVQGVRLLYNSQPDFQGVDGKTSSGGGGDKGAATLVLLGFGSDNKPYKNPYGGDYELAAQNEDRTFTLSITGLGNKTCKLLASRDWTGGGKDATCTEDTVTVKYEKADTKVNP